MTERPGSSAARCATSCSAARSRDFDVAVAGDPARAARALAQELRGPVFRLSEAFGAWRVVDREGGRVYDFAPLQGETIEEDLRRRDFTVNAMARVRVGGRRPDRPARRPRRPRGAGRCA